MCFVLRSETGRYEENGNVFWKKNGVEHREDGPAIEWADGSKHWYLNGYRHRVDGPAIEWSCGKKEWYINGMRHRDSGPSWVMEVLSGTLEIWENMGKRHRLDGPAVNYCNEWVEWWVYGQKIDIQSVLGYEPSVPLTEEEQKILARYGNNETK